MPSLHIPESGLPLGNSRRAASEPGSAVQDAFALTLTDSVIEDMIKCVHNGKPIQLSLGEYPSLQYGPKTQNLSASLDSLHHELYRSTFSDSDSEASSEDDEMDPLPPNLKKGVVKVQNKVHTGFMAMFGKTGLVPSKRKLPETSKASTPATMPASATAGVDDALASLKNSLASEKAKKDEKTLNYVKDGSLGTPGRRGGASGKATKSKFPNRLGGETTRSMPTSPALSGIGSPSLGPTSVPLSQQQAEKAKATRKPVIHLLAVGPMREASLIAKIEDEVSNDIKQALRKVGDLNETTGKWELRKNYYKELDVWTFYYGSQDERQQAIDNAVRIYDKMRLAISDPEWDRLLPKKERGTGKVLSKLQKDIAEGLGRGPKINVQKAEDSGRDTPILKEDESMADKQVSKLKGDCTPRAASQPAAAKPKKASEKEARAKRLLSSKPTKAATPKAPVKKEKPAPKPIGKALSSQYVNSSDDEDDFLATTITTKPAPKPQPLKRSRDDEDTSDSSIPLSKKVKKDSKPEPKVRNLDSQSSRATTSSTYSSNSNSNSNSQAHSQQRTKGTSPQKSSPLASSPPTNASEFESSSANSSGRASPVHSSTRKPSSSPIHKRHQKSSSVTSSSSNSSQRSLKPAVVDLARKYRSFYPKYQALHHEVANLGRRDREMETRLLDMHERLSSMKAEILGGIIEVS